MVDVRVMLCAVVPIIVGSFVPVCPKLALWLSAAQPVESQIPRLWLFWDQCWVGHSYRCGVVGLEGAWGCFHPISARVFHSGTISLAVRNKAVVSASSADDTTYFIIWAMVSRDLFQRGMELFSDKKTVGTSSASWLFFIGKAGVRVCREDHVAWLIDNAIAWVCGTLVQKLVNGIVCGFYCWGLLGANCAEGNK